MSIETRNMLKVFLDTNIAFDLIANREPFVLSSIHFLELAEKGEAQLFVSEVSIGTLIYLAYARYKLPDAKEKLIQFVEFCEVISGGSEAFLNAINSNFSDKEDGLQYFIALANEMDIIITRDRKGFDQADGKVPILSPKEFFAS